MRKYIIGFIVGLMIASAVPAYGAVSSLVGKNVDSEIVVNLNSKELGTAIVVEGRSYLPLRVAAEALQLELDVTTEAINLMSTKPIVVENDNFDQLQSFIGAIEGLSGLKANAIKKRDQLIEILKKPNDKLFRAKELLSEMGESDPRRENQLDVVATFEQAQKDNEKNIIELQSKVTEYDRQITELETQKSALLLP
jgi:hypothetical protein